MDIVHTSVLKEEVLTYLSPEKPDELFIDGTMGEGGHSELFLSRFPEIRVIGLNADARILAKAKERLAPFGDRVRFENQWFDEFFSNYSPEAERPSLILLDLGISMFHYESSGRGFSFQKNEALDMRLSEGLEISAADVVNSYPESELADLIYTLSDEGFSRRIARSIVEVRKSKRISTTAELADIVRAAVPGKFRHGRIHPATKTFQALRIAVNGELERLTSVLASAVEVLLPGGRIGVISFHSLEDRIVKRFFREKNKSCTCPPNAPMCICEGKALLSLLTRKPVMPGEEEIRSNPASRSSKLRVARKLYDPGDSA